MGVMANFSRTFGINANQATLDFVDVELDSDTPLYLDPYAIQIKGDDWSIKCGDYIRSFFTELLNALRASNSARATHLLQNLHEPNETRLGVSKGKANGKAIGEKKAKLLAEAIKRSRAFSTGNLSDMSEAELFVRLIGPDTISDMVTNVLRGLLAEYTYEQCQIHGIKTEPVNTLGPVWNNQSLDWESKTLNLPVYTNFPNYILDPILLIPKFTVRRHPMVKDGLAEFVAKHPEILEAYKKLKGAAGPLSNEELTLILDDEFFDERLFATSLSNRLRTIAPGNASAEDYHSVTMGICTFLFYPALSIPVKEHEIHQGRKRIDFKYTNSATQGFFHSMLQHAGTRSIDVPFECKNYSKDVANPEMDQISGRFSIHRGRLGFLLCRSVDNKARLIERCRDTVTDDRGYVIVFDDDDLHEMLMYVRDGDREALDKFLHGKFSEIVG